MRLLAIVLLSFVTSHAAVAAGFVIPNSETHEIKSEILSRSYDVYVKTPRGYDDPENAGKKYPVIYLNDGPYTFQVASGVTRIPINSGKFEGVILVGMSFAQGEKPMASRTRDLTPTVAEGWNNETGGAEKYLSFLRDEVFPFVETSYRADAERRVLSGLSFGGLFGVYVLVTAPETFDAYILTSPSLWFDQKVMFAMEEAYAANNKDMKAKVYMATGDQERPHLATINDLVADQNEFAARLRSRSYPSLILRDEIIPDALHETAFPIGFTRGAQWLFYKGEE